MPNRRKQDRKYIAFTAFMLICTAIVFYSIGYEAGARLTRDAVLEATK